MKKAAKKVPEPARPSFHPVKGWIILHPNGWVETDYFGMTNWKTDETPSGEREEWRELFRPECRIVFATLVISLDDMPTPPRKARKGGNPPA